MRNISSKIYPREKLSKILKILRDSGKIIGVTNGAFDILHAGHVTYLEQAKKKCDILVVSVNTDKSIKEYKDPQRPINPEGDRAKVVAALESVDYVTFHDERRMRATLEALKPNYYIKAADYNSSTLTSADVLKEWGGKPLLIPLVEGRSTTKILEKIIDLYKEKPISLDIKNKSPRKAIFLDRDGVINEEIEYLHEPEKFKFVKGALEGIKKMQDMGFAIVIVTNQAGIGLGYFTKEDFFRVNKVMLRGFYDNGIIISKIYFCPHSLSDNCTCRKPKIGLFKRAREDLNIDFGSSFVIGDKVSDIEAGKKIGAKTIFVMMGHGAKFKSTKIKPDRVVGNLIEAAEFISK